MFAGSASHQTGRFICRAWSIEPKSVAVDHQIDFANQKIVPSIPTEISTPYLAYIYGSYESTTQEGSFDRGCGDSGYWRSRTPVHGESFVIDSEGRNDVYHARGVNFDSDQPWPSTIVPISDGDYQIRTTSDLSDMKSLSPA